MLVSVETDAMTGAVEELLGVAGLADRPPRRAIDLLRRSAASRRRVAGLLGAPHGVVNAPDLVRDGALSDEEGARDVRGVTAHGPAEIAHHDIAVLDHALSGLVMRRCAVGAGSDDAELDLLVSFFKQERGQVACDLMLAAPGKAHVARESFEGAIRGRRRVAQGGELLVVLAHSQRTQDLGRGHQSRPRERTSERQYERGPHLIRECERRGVADELAHARDRILRLAPRHERNACLRRARPRRLEHWHEEFGLTASGEDEARQSFARKDPVTRQIGQIRRGRQQKGIDAAFRKCLRGAHASLRDVLVHECRTLGIPLSVARPPAKATVRAPSHTSKG